MVEIKIKSCNRCICISTDEGVKAKCLFKIVTVINQYL